MKPLMRLLLKKLLNVRKHSPTIETLSFFMRENGVSNYFLRSSNAFTINSLVTFRSALPLRHFIWLQDKLWWREQLAQRTIGSFTAL